MQSVLQAFIIKYFIFDCKPRDKSVVMEELLKPTEAEQAQALYLAISDILWNIGEKTKALIVLPGENSLIPHSHAYFQDNVTEKLFFFEFTKLDEMQIFMKRYLPYVSDSFDLLKSSVLNLASSFLVHGEPRSGCTAVAVQRRGHAWHGESAKRSGRTKGSTFDGSVRGRLIEYSHFDANWPCHAVPAQRRRLRRRRGPLREYCRIYDRKHERYGFFRNNYDL